MLVSGIYHGYHMLVSDKVCHLSWILYAGV